MRIVRVDHLHRFDDFAQRLEGEHAAISSIVVRESSLLRDYRSSGCQVARAAVAEPAGFKPHVLVLCDGELPLGAPDVIAITLRIETEPRRRSELPAVTLKLRAQLSSFAAGCDLERLPGSARRGDELEELRCLAPQVSLSSPGEVLLSGCAQVSHCGQQCAACRWAAGSPEVGYDRLACGHPFNAVTRDNEVGRADVLAKGEESVM